MSVSEIIQNLFDFRHGRGADSASLPDAVIQRQKIRRGSQFVGALGDRIRVFRSEIKVMFARRGTEEILLRRRGAEIVFCSSACRSIPKL
ncbi:hypothetical protein HPP92_001780 [Vanilla planifolia]|uniref:Uncharacterized protein n=1 Tax=Vanilla planifolia TaxID=51239 RepID=A0A835SDE7_VANPL|nr:hypothetical protein HPP92_001780 [Vanilla planifolia]